MGDALPRLVRRISGGACPAIFHKEHKIAGLQTAPLRRRLTDGLHIIALAAGIARQRDAEGILKRLADKVGAVERLRIGPVGSIFVRRPQILLACGDDLAAGRARFGGRGA